MRDLLDAVGSIDIDAYELAEQISALESSDLRRRVLLNDGKPSERR